MTWMARVVGVSVPKAGRGSTKTRQDEILDEYIDGRVDDRFT
jgi:hypothetical protein